MTDRTNLVLLCTGSFLAIMSGTLSSSLLKIIMSAGVLVLFGSAIINIYNDKYQ